MGSVESSKKSIYLNFFDVASKGNHMCPGQWKNPADNVQGKDRLEYWIKLAQLAERGKINFIFFADSYGGSGSVGMDPMMVVPVMASVTKTVGFEVSASTSYENPFVLARRMSTLDHLNNGRIAWNVVTSWAKSSANALGVDSVVAHDERYAMADEYMDLVYKLWESSWSEDAVKFDKKSSTAYDSRKIQKIEHKGKYFKCSARHQTHPSPQRTPVIFQAGTSKAGRAFGAKHAEAVYIGGLFPSQSADAVKQMREQAAANGRDPNSIKFFVGICPIIGRTLTEAQEKARITEECADPFSGLATFSAFTGIDLSTYPLDEKLVLSDAPKDNAIHSFTENFNHASGQDNTEIWTPRRLGQKMALGGFHPAPVGTPEMVADVFEQWINEADVDGFNISYVTSPGSFEDIVDLLRPELVRRGYLGEDYPVPGGTLRENFNGVGKSGLHDDHYGSSFKRKHDLISESEEMAPKEVEAKKQAMGTGARVTQTSITI